MSTDKPAVRTPRQPSPQGRRGSPTARARGAGRVPPARNRTSTTVQPAAPAHAAHGAGPCILNLALQGGGSHGAYTWGVLDALLEDPRPQFDGISGASAGAMNAVVLADGWLDGVAAGRDPRESARAALRSFWSAIGGQPSVFSLNGAWLGLSPALGHHPVFVWLDLVSRLASPYQLNPFNFNPLRRVLEARVDFERLRRASPFKLFIGATDVRTGRPEIFREHKLVIDMVLASACLPFAFQAVAVDVERTRVIDGRKVEAVATEHFWDGGYMGNPPLWPLFYDTGSCDLLLVQINPLRRDDVPDTGQEIAERVNEVSFNASLLHEMRAIDFVIRLLESHQLDPHKYKGIRLHVASAEDAMKRFGASSKYNTTPVFLEQLFQLGRRTGQAWLQENWRWVGKKATVPPRTFL
jgi:NTE family protein